jgi:hypothetical protein
MALTANKGKYLKLKIQIKASKELY